MQRSTKIIAICGIDGAGKSTIVNYLESIELLQDAVFVRKLSSPNFDLVRRYHARNHRDGKDWVEGAFAVSAVYAWALDYLDHYDRSIRPWIGRKQYIVCDRYTPCAVAFAKICGLDLKGLFAETAPADMTVYLDVSVDRVYERFQQRGGPSEDENPYVMPLFVRAYESMFRDSPRPILRVRNDASFENACAVLLEGLTEWLEHRETHDAKGGRKGACAWGD